MDIARRSFRRVRLPPVLPPLPKPTVQASRPVSCPRIEEIFKKPDQIATDPNRPRCIAIAEPNFRIQRHGDERLAVLDADRVNWLLLKRQHSLVILQHESHPCVAGQTLNFVQQPPFKAGDAGAGHGWMLLSLNEAWTGPPVVLRGAMQSLERHQLFDVG